MSKKSLVESTIILTSASLFTRLIGFFFRIFMNRELGTYQMGLYQLIMPIYMLAWSFICSGFTTTISKFTSEYNALNDKQTMKKVFYYSTIISVTIGILTTFVFLSFSEYIAENIVKEAVLAIPLKIISISFPFMALGSCIRGYFLGLQQPNVPSKSQVLEQLSRIGLICFFIYLTGSLTINIAILGIAFAETVSCLYAFVKYLQHNKKNRNIYTYTKTSSKNVLPLIALSALPLTLNRVTHSLLHTYENLLINEKLVLYGFTREEALSEFGKITGLTFPLIFFPTTIILSISISLLASISSLYANKNYKAINSLLYKVMLFTLILSMFFASVFVIFSKELGLLLYNTDISFNLVFFGLLSPFIYTQMILSSILNGLGKEFTLFVNSTFSSLVTIITIILLVPKYGVIGFIIAFTLSIISISFLNYICITKKMPLSFSILQLSIKPLIVMILTTMSMILFKSTLNTTLSYLHLLILSLITTCLFGLLLVLLKVITMKDIRKVLSLVKTNLGKLTHMYD